MGDSKFSLETVVRVSSADLQRYQGSEEQTAVSNAVFSEMGVHAVQFVEGELKSVRVVPFFDPNAPRAVLKSGPADCYAVVSDRNLVQGSWYYSLQFVCHDATGPPISPDHAWLDIPERLLEEQYGFAEGLVGLEKYLAYFNVQARRAEQRLAWAGQ